MHNRSLVKRSTEHELKRIRTTLYIFESLSANCLKSFLFKISLLLSEEVVFSIQTISNANRRVRFSQPAFCD